MTDEGQRQLKVLDFSVEWYNLEYTPLIQLHFLTNRSPPLISHNKNIGSEVPLFCCDSFPPGEAKGCKPLACTLCYRAYAFNRVLAEIRGFGRILSAPTEGVCHAAGRFGNGDVFIG